MQNTVLVTGADRGLGLGLCEGLLKQGWIVYAGQYMPDWPDLTALQAQYQQALHVLALDVQSIESAQAAAKTMRTQSIRLDMLINNAGVITQNTPTVSEPQDYAALHRVFDVNSLGPLRMVEAFLPLMQHSAFKRLCFVSSEAGSIARCKRTAWYGYCMSKAALNMAVKIMFNQLRPEGYSFRLYHPGWMRTYMSGTKNTQGDMEPAEAASKAVPFFLSDRPDEDTLALVDYLGQEWPW
ncbi:MAG TPA: SDR family NAD(P)-dependent oxidoreductase [Anaerolineae bacterium]